MWPELQASISALQQLHWLADDDFFLGQQPTIVRVDNNPGNFLRRGQRPLALVDWEQAVIAPRWLAVGTILRLAHDEQAPQLFTAYCAAVPGPVTADQRRDAEEFLYLAAEAELLLATIWLRPLAAKAAKRPSTNATAHLGEDLVTATRRTAPWLTADLSSKLGRL